MQHCKELNNFNAMMEILSGLQASAVYRLKHTFSVRPASVVVVVVIIIWCCG